MTGWDSSIDPHSYEIGLVPLN